MLGKEHVQHRREIAHREREKAKAAARASVAREKAKVAAEASVARARAKVAAKASRERAKAKVAAEANVERAKAKVAAKASVERQKARDAEKQARYDDIYSALRGLGSTAAEARRGAEMADGMPGASLEACLRLALTVLARPVAMRGERRARSTA